jgi:hypothetical protein
MKVTPRRRRSDSAAAAVAATQAAALGPLPPPAYIRLRENDRPFWDAIVLARARDTWTAPDLASAAAMARAQADIERLQADIERDGEVVTAANGSPTLSPQVKLLEMLTRRVMALARMLHVHAEATIGKSEDSAKALANERQARAEHDDDDLIPRLRSVA